MSQDRMLGVRRWFMSAVSVTLLWVVCSYVPTESAEVSRAADADLHDIDIPPGLLVDALEQLAKQFRLELVYDADQLKGLTTPGVDGRMTTLAAVHRLVEGDSLRLIEHPDGAILVTPSRPEDPPSINDVERSAMSPTESSNTVRHDTTSDPDSTGLREAVLRTIVVTGTHIPGETPVGSSMIIHTREEIQESGSATLEQFGRKMTENYAGTDTVATVNTNAGLGSFEQGASSNVFGGAGFNLKGLGPGSTLTLLNGRRLAAGGLDGSIVDISQIPLSAVDHIEVLDDGASAIYGSDAVAGVVNIITRRNFEGEETGLRYGRATQGGAAEVTASQVAGRSWSTGNLMVDYEYDDQGGLDASQRSWIGSQGGHFSLLPENRRQSVFVTGRQEVADGLMTSADLLYTDRHFENYGVQNGINSSVNGPQFSAGHVTQSAASVTVDRHLFEQWNATLTANYSSIRQLADTVTGGANGVFDGVSGFDREEANSDVRGVDILLSGPVPDLGDGTVKESWGASVRSEDFQSVTNIVQNYTEVSQSRTVASGYAEVIAPIVSDGPRGLRRLEVSGAFRFDHYQGFGSTHNPKIGWLWEPLTGLRLKGTASTSFKSPLLSQLGAPVTAYTALFPSGEPSPSKTDALIINGGNPGLHAENASSVTLGFEYQPTPLPGLTLSTNGFWLRFDNRIQTQLIQAQPIPSQPQLQFITLNAKPYYLQYVQAYFAGGRFQGDNAGLGPAGVDFIVDDQLANTATTREAGVNMSSRYGWRTDYGDVGLWIAGQYLVTDRIRPIAAEPEFTVDNTLGEPPKFKGRSGFNWTRGGATVDVSLSYVNGYQNTLFSPPQRIGSWTTADVYLGYSTGTKQGKPWSDWQVGLSVQNLMDQRPPYLQIPAADLPTGRSGIPFDGTNASPVGRLIAVQIQKRW